MHLTIEPDGKCDNSACVSRLAWGRESHQRLVQQDRTQGSKTLAKILGTREIAVFHHTGCGMLTFDTPQLRKLVKDSDPSNPALSAVDEIDFHEFNGLEESIKADVKFLEENPLVLPGTKITGWVYEVETGKVSFVLYCAIVASCSRDVVEERGAYSWPTDKTGCVIQLTLF